MTDICIVSPTLERATKAWGTAYHLLKFDDANKANLRITAGNVTFHFCSGNQPDKIRRFRGPVLSDNEFFDMVEEHR